MQLGIRQPIEVTAVCLNDGQLLARRFLDKDLIEAPRVRNVILTADVAELQDQFAHEFDSARTRLVQRKICGARE